MIRRMERSHDGFYGIECEGEVSAEQFAALLPEIETLIGRHGRINMLCVLKGMTGYGLKEFVEDMRFLVKHWNHIGKMAVVTDQPGWAAATRISGHLLKWETRVFAPPEEDQAWAWLEA